MGLEVYGAKLEVKTQQQTRLKLDTGNTPVETLGQFCKAEKVASQIKKAGMEFINGDENLL